MDPNYHKHKHTQRDKLSVEIHVICMGFYFLPVCVQFIVNWALIVIQVEDIVSFDENDMDDGLWIYAYLFIVKFRNKSSCCKYTKSFGDWGYLRSQGWKRRDLIVVHPRMELILLLLCIRKPCQCCTPETGHLVCYLITTIFFIICIIYQTT